MLLFGRWTYAEPSQAARTQQLTIREYQPGDERVREYPLQLELVPTVALERALGECSARAGVLEVNGVRAFRSPLGMLRASLVQCPKSTQFFRPRGAPLYPVETISSFKTIMAPYCRRRHVDRLDTVSAISR